MLIGLRLSTRFGLSPTHTNVHICLWLLNTYTNLGYTIGSFGPRCEQTTVCYHRHQQKYSLSLSYIYKCKYMPCHDTRQIIIIQMDENNI